MLLSVPFGSALGRTENHSARRTFLESGGEQTSEVSSWASDVVVLMSVSLGLALRAYRAKRIVLWDCPPKSPDLNPVEMFWGWMRKKLRRMDLADLRKKRKPLGKVAYHAKLKSVHSAFRTDN